MLLIFAWISDVPNFIYIEPLEDIFIIVCIDIKGLRLLLIQKFYPVKYSASPA